MKKVFLALAITAAFAWVVIYLFLPNQYQEQVLLSAKVPPYVANRVLSNDSLWQLATQGEATATDSGILFHQRHYHVANSNIDETIVSIQTGLGNITSQILVTLSANDSIFLSWQAPVASAKNPIARIQLLSEKNRLVADMMHILYNLRQLMEQPKALYGFDMEPGMMTDSILLTHSFESVDSPSVQTIYQKIAQLQHYADTNEAIATNAPMLSIRKPAAAQIYLVQIALPVNKWLPSKGPIQVKRMVLGKKLACMVQGPATRIGKAYQAMRQYINDYSLAVPAIPYELLLNDRRTTDSSQWKTRVIFPVY